MKVVAVLKKGSVFSPLYFCKLWNYLQNPKDLALPGCESSRIAMGSRDDSIHHGETSYYIACS